MKVFFSVCFIVFSMLVAGVSYAQFFLPKGPATEEYLHMKKTISYEHNDKGDVKSKKVIYDDGLLKREAHGLDTDKVVLKSYYHNGALKSVMAFKNKKLDGPFNEYFENGQRGSEFHYKNALMDGDFKRWNKHGRLIVEGFYKEGKYDGIVKNYYSNGSLKNETEYKNGILNGIYRNYDVQGVLIVDDEFENGKNKR